MCQVFERFFFHLCAAKLVWIEYLSIYLVLKSVAYPIMTSVLLSDKIKPSDVGLEQEAQLARGWTGSGSGQNGGLRPIPPIKYLHLFECDSFTVRVTHILHF